MLSGGSNSAAGCTKAEALGMLPRGENETVCKLPFRIASAMAEWRQLWRARLQALTFEEGECFCRSHARRGQIPQQGRVDRLRPPPDSGAYAIVSRDESCGATLGVYLSRGAFPLQRLSETAASKIARAVSRNGQGPVIETKDATVPCKLLTPSMKGFVKFTPW